MIAIVDYGMGNLRSVSNMLNYIGIPSVVTSEHKKIKNASKIILPGVGHFKRGMDNLESGGFIELINQCVYADKKYILGICLGAQLMTEYSEEGDMEGLQFVKAKTVAFKKAELNGLKVPHMGWADIKVIDNNPLWKDLPPEPRFYHVHSYHFEIQEAQIISATARYGYDFVCAFRQENIFGVQFHPEKSHKYGMKVLENFCKLS